MRPRWGCHFGSSGSSNHPAVLGGNRFVLLIMVGFLRVLLRVKEIEDWLTLQDFGQLIPVCTGTEYAIKRRPKTHADMGELCESEAESIPDGA